MGSWARRGGGPGGCQPARVGVLSGQAECDFRQNPERQAAIRQGRTRGLCGRERVGEAWTRAREPLRARGRRSGAGGPRRMEKGEGRGVGGGQQLARSEAAGPAKEPGPGASLLPVVPHLSTSVLSPTRVSSCSPSLMQHLAPQWLIASTSDF